MSGQLVHKPNLEVGGAQPLELHLNESDFECMKQLLEWKINEDLAEEVAYLEREPPQLLFTTELDGLNRLIDAVKEDTPNLVQSKDRKTILFRFEREFFYLLDCGNEAVETRDGYELSHELEPPPFPPTQNHCAVAQPLGGIFREFLSSIKHNDIRTTIQVVYDYNEARDAFHKMVRLIRLAVVATK